MHDDQVITERDIINDSTYAPAPPPPFTPPKPSELEMQRRRTILLDHLAINGLSEISLLEGDSDSGPQLRLSSNLKEANSHQSRTIFERQISERSKKVVAVALFDFQAVTATDLSFSKGDHIVILTQDTSSSWWQGACGHDIGYFPSDYVALLDGKTPMSIIAFATTPQQPSQKPVLSSVSTFPCTSVPDSPISQVSSVPSSQPRRCIFDPSQSDSVVEQLRKRISEQTLKQSAIKKRLMMQNPSHPEYHELKSQMEESSILLESLEKNLPETRQLQTLKNAEDDDVAAQIKMRITAENRELEALQNQLRNTMGTTSSQYHHLKTLQEEHQLLLESLYCSLQALARVKIEEEGQEKFGEMKKEQSEVESLLRRKISDAEVDIHTLKEKLSTSLTLSPSQKVELQKDIEERGMLLLALQGNLEAMSLQIQQPNFNEICCLPHDKRSESCAKKKGRMGFFNKHNSGSSPESLIVLSQPLMISSTNEKFIPSCQTTNCDNTFNTAGSPGGGRHKRSAPIPISLSSSKSTSSSSLTSTSTSTSSASPEGLKVCSVSIATEQTSPTQQRFPRPSHAPPKPPNSPTVSASPGSSPLQIFNHQTRKGSDAPLISPETLIPAPGK